MPRRILASGDAISLVVAPDAVDLPDDIREIHKLWVSACAGNRLPPRNALNLVAFPSAVLPWTIIIDLDSPGRVVPEKIRYRFWGTEWSRLYAQEMSGKFMAELKVGSVVKSLSDQYALIVGDQAPQVFLNSYPTPAGVPADTLSLRLPFGHAEGQVTQVLSVTHFIRNRDAYAQCFDHVGRLELQRLTI